MSFDPSLLLFNCLNSAIVLVVLIFCIILRIGLESAVELSFKDDEDDEVDETEDLKDMDEDEISKDNASVYSANFL